MLKLRTILLHDKLYYLIFIVVIIITIVNIKIPRTSIYDSTTTKVTGKIISQSIDGNKLTLIIKSKEKLIINYYFKEENEKTLYQTKFHLGDYIKVEGEFIKPKSATTKYLFDYKKYLYHKNIFFIINTQKLIKVKDNKNVYYNIKNIMTNLTNKNAYLKTFILGDKSLLSTKIITSYQENGISHLFAISGMHITLLSSLITKALKRLKLSETKCYYITSIILIMYLFLVGLSPSILRGVLFYLLFSLNKIYYFYIKPVNLFLLTTSISLLINYNYIYDIGFLYSFSISLSLILTTKYLTSNNYLIGLLKTSIISFLVSIPISLYNFHQINILSIIYNLFFVPYVSIIVFPITIVTTFAPFLLPIYELLIKILENISLALFNIKVLTLIFPRLHIIVYLLYYILIIIFIKGLLSKNKKQLLPLFFLLIIHYTYPYLNKDILIEMIDVGQGDSLIISSKNKAVLIDTGGKVKYKQEEWQKTNKDSSIVKNITIPLLKSKGLKKIDFLIITHGDYDHMGEAINLVNNFKVKKVIFNCGEFNYLEKELIKVLDKKKIKYYSCIKELNIDNNKLYFLQTKEYDNENDNSNVIYTELDGYKFMFMGDAGVEKEKDILEKYNLSNIDVLKVGHHGSKTSSSKEFINEINPNYSIISVGKNNRYGHPNKEVLNNLSDSKIYRTDQDGSIMFKIRNNKLKIKTCSS